MPYIKPCKSYMRHLLSFFWCTGFNPPASWHPQDAVVEDLACQYLASIPPCAVPRPIKAQEVVPIKFKFPDRVVRENIT